MVFHILSILCFRPKTISTIAVHKHSCESCCRCCCFAIAIAVCVDIAVDLLVRMVAAPGFADVMIVF